MCVCVHCMPCSAYVRFSGDSVIQACGFWNLRSGQRKRSSSMIKRPCGAETLSPLQPLLLLPLGSCNSCSMCKAPPLTDTHTVQGSCSPRLHDEWGHREEVCAFYRVTSHFCNPNIVHLLCVCEQSAFLWPPGCLLFLQPLQSHSQTICPVCSLPGQG